MGPLGTFAGHPAVMGSMNAFLTWHSRPETPDECDEMHGLAARRISF